MQRLRQYIALAREFIASQLPEKTEAVLKDEWRTLIKPFLRVGATGFGGGFSGEDADKTAHAAFVFEVDDSGDEGEESVVFAAADVEAGLALGAALADEDGAGIDELPAETLGAEALTLGVTPVCR